ncbi:MAG TPA: hypothetical protein VN253_17435, partial [Kofleriaceae bacterium]|nr:hypothetical protein [Kofleriaceae bacterium]
MLPHARPQRALVKREIQLGRTLVSRAAGVALNDRRARPASPDLIEQRLGGCTADHGIRDRIRVLLVLRVLPRDSHPLLDDVRGLVRRGPKIRRLGEGHVIADRERARAERARRHSCCVVRVDANARKIVMAEARLQLGGKWQWMARARDARCCDRHLGPRGRSRITGPGPRAARASTAVMAHAQRPGAYLVGKSVRHDPAIAGIAERVLHRPLQLRKRRQPLASGGARHPRYMRLRRG